MVWRCDDVMVGVVGVAVVWSNEFPEAQRSVEAVAVVRGGRIHTLIAIAAVEV